MKTSFQSTIRLLPGVYLPVRASIIKLETATIMMSPCELSEDDIFNIKSSTEVSDIVAPNLLHHHYIIKALGAFPRARLWHAPGMMEKIPEVPWQRPLDLKTWPFRRELELHMIEGAPRVNECVFYHRATKTLYVTDLCFNIEHPKGFLTPVTFRMMGTYKKFAVSNMWNRFVEDKEAFKKSMNYILSWDFERIVMAHGEIVEHEAKTRLRTSLASLGLI